MPRAVQLRAVRAVSLLEDTMTIEDIRAAYDRAYHRHMSNLDASINAVHDPMCTVADLRRYADACDESRTELQRASRALNQSSGQVTE